MKKECTASRLKQLMDEKQLRQIDILNLSKPFCEQYNVKMNKSDLSQYCSGKTEPNQDKLFILGKALDVSEAWLMGFDVPRQRNFDLVVPSANGNDFFIEVKSSTGSNLGTQQRMLMYYYLLLNSTGQKEAIKRLEELTHIPQYIKAGTPLLNAARPIPDVEATKELIKHDEDIMDDEDF